ncbi:MAG: efflux RND transporter periplasmic adaptor subunit [Colwellia sp.]|nr:efflux RND transporter periplasmic adaptor subunit [Colwellia sp.]
MKSLFILVNILLLISSFLSVAQSYDMEEVSAVPYTDVIKRTGKLDYKRVLNLSFKSSGFLTQLSVDEGDSFEKKQLLASLDTIELKENKNANYAQLLQAKRDVSRLTQLLEKGLTSERELDVAETAVETTRASYKVAFYNLEKAQIYAPFAGVVLARHTELGELQSPGREVLQIAALKNNWVVKVALTGLEVSQVSLDQEVKVSLSHLGNVRGVISKIPAIADRVSHLFIIEVLLPDVTLKAGMIAGQLAGVIIDFTSENFVYRLPIEALVSVDANGDALVIVQADNNSFEKKSFKIFQLDNNFVYLQASNDEKPLKIISKGWQNFTLVGQ